MAEIIEELPRLSHHERRQLGQRLVALEAGQEELVACDQAAADGFALLDRMEAEDAANVRRP
jgi:hypothetical protein